MSQDKWKANRTIPGGVVKIEVGKGVMSKDGVTPWAAGTIHYTSESGWSHAAKFCWKNLAILMADPTVVDIRVIDDENNQITITLNKEWTPPTRLVEPPAEA